MSYNDLIKRANTETFDDIEKAQMFQLAQQESLIEGILKKNKIIPLDFDGIHCYECGEKMNKKRLEMGFFVCFDCQTEKERLEKIKNR